MGVYSGKYDNLMSLYTRSLTKSTTGQESITWTEYVTEIPCKYLSLGGSDNVEDTQRVASNMFEFRMHYPHSFEVLETMEILYEGSRFKIENIHESDNGRRVELVIKATKKDNQ